jgi:glucokinase
MLLAGDIGGTKTTVILFSTEGSTLKSVFRMRVGTKEFSSVVNLIQSVLKRAREEHIAIDGLKIARCVVSYFSSQNLRLMLSY